MKDGLKKALEIVERVASAEKEKRYNIERNRNFSDAEVIAHRKEDKLLLTISGLIEVEMEK